MRIKTDKTIILFIPVFNIAPHTSFCGYLSWFFQGHNLSYLLFSSPPFKLPQLKIFAILKSVFAEFFAQGCGLSRDR